jgi:acetolactate synthase small subunit
MEVRIARITNLLKKTDGISENADTTDEQFTQFLSDKQGKPNDSRHNSEKKQGDSHLAMMSLSAKGAKHINMLNKTQTEQDNTTYTTVHNEITQLIKNLSDQVVKGQFSETDRANFDTELKLLSSLLANADDETKCRILSERINNLSKIVNAAVVDVNEDEAIYKLIDPNYNMDKV